MVDLRRQYLRLRPDIDRAISEVVGDTHFINGPQVKRFAESLESYLRVSHVVTCGNGTDALQIALMALDLRPGDEVIVPAFTYVAAAEVVALLGLIPVWVDVDPITFTINPSLVEGAISGKTKAIVAVHLFGQCADMEPLMRIPGWPYTKGGYDRAYWDNLILSLQAFSLFRGWWRLDD